MTTFTPDAHRITTRSPGTDTMARIKDSALLGERQNGAWFVAAVKKSGLSTAIHVAQILADEADLDGSQSDLVNMNLIRVAGPLFEDESDARTFAYELLSESESPAALVRMKEKATGQYPSLRTRSFEEAKLWQATNLVSLAADDEEAGDALYAESCYELGEELVHELENRTLRPSG